MRYGIIGNCKTAASIHESGKIEWCCLPNFDSPSVFASLLDPQGGHFQVGPAGPSTIQQSYLPQTNILQTEFIDGENAFAVIDFMPRYREGEAYRHPIEIHRLLRPLRSHPVMQILFHPALNYAQGETRLELFPHVISATHELEDVTTVQQLDSSDTGLEQKHWEEYQRVNQQYCKTLLDILKPDDVVWIHDCQLMLLPQLIRKARPEITIGFFLHIPFPPFEIFRFLPIQWRQTLLSGLLGADLLGFHTHDYTQRSLAHPTPKAQRSSIN